MTTDILSGLQAERAQQEIADRHRERLLRSQNSETPAATGAPAGENEALPEAPEGKDGDTGFFNDVGRGIVNAPRRIARGVTGALIEIDSILEDLNAATGAPALQLFNDKGEFDLDILTRGEIDASGATSAISDALKKIQPNEPLKGSVTGKVIETVAQFMTGLKGVDKALKASKFGRAADAAARATTKGKIASGAVKGAAADTAVFDAQEERLSNLIESVPELQNPVTAYLAADANDTESEAKFKQSIEAMALGGLTEGLFEGVRAWKRTRAAVKDAGGAEKLLELPAEEAAGVGLRAEDFFFLGDAGDENLFTRRTASTADDAAASAKEKLNRAADETENVGYRIGDAPDDIADYRINYARIDGPDDIKSVMDQMLNRPELKPFIEAERRGTRSNAETLKAAEDIDGFATLMQRRTGEAYNAETIVAARRVYYDSTEKLMEAAKRAASPAATTADHFAFRKMVAVHHAVQKEFMGFRAEAGRALQAWNIPLGGTPGRTLRETENLLTQYGGAETSQLLARKLTSLGDNIDTAQINAITRRSASARTLEAVTEAWTLGLLTNPQTHVVNLTSNILTGLTLGAERFVQGARGDSAVTTQEAAAYMYGYLGAQKEALKNAAKAFRTGQTGFGTGKLELPRERLTSREYLDAQGMFAPFGYALDYYGRMVSVAGNALAAGDEYAKTAIYRAQMHALATREAIAEGLDGRALKERVAERLADPDALMRESAVDYANYATFTRQLGQSGRALQSAIARQPALRFVAPFVRTPINIFKFTYERTPLAPISQAIRDDLRAGGLRRSTAMAKMGAGSSLMWLGTDWALNGLITGAGPANNKQRAALRRTGWQPYSIKIGDDYYSYSRFEPVATLLGLSADMAEILSNYEAYDIQAQEDVEKLATAAIAAIGNQVIGKTFMSGFADITEVFSDPKRYSDRFLNRFAGSFVPAGSAALERAGDPALEEVFNMADALKSRIPGMSDSVPNRLNVWGEEIKTFYPSGDALTDATGERVASLFNPVYYSAGKPAELDRFLLRNGFSVSMPDKTQTLDGVRVDLRDFPEIYSRFVKLAAGHELEDTAISAKYGGRTLKEELTDIVTGDSMYSTVFLSDFTEAEEQQQLISRIQSDYREAARDQLLREFPTLQRIVAEEREKQEMLNENRSADAPLLPLP